MEGHTATLTPALKQTIARQAIAGQGRHGALTSLANQHGVSRQTVYTLKERAEHAIDATFHRPPPTARSHRLARIEVDARHVQRAVLALRAVGCNSVPDIVELSELLLGVRRGYGTVWRILDAGATAATEFNRRVELEHIKAIALDEIFVGRRPVLCGRCLDSGYVFCCQASERRDAAAWAAALQPCIERGLDPCVVLSDGAKGIKAAVGQCWPDAELREDLFHIKRSLLNDARWFFNRAVRAISTEYELCEKHERAVACHADERASLAQQHRRARESAALAIERSDAFERLVTCGLDEALALYESESLELRHTGQMRDALLRLCSQLEALRHSRARQAAGYLRRRIPWLLAHLDERDNALDALEQAFGVDAVRFAAQLHQAQCGAAKDGGLLDRLARLLAARRGLSQCGLGDAHEAALLEGVSAALKRRYHRASSGVESFNSLLRPHLDVHRGASMRFLPLFTAHENLRRRRSGRNKGRSCYELLTRKPHAEWLSELGYPPSDSLH